MESTNIPSKFSYLDHKCIHEENRFKLCAPCGQKIVFGSKKPNTFFISNKVEGLVKRFINKNFDINNAKFPKSICVTCRLTLNERDKGIVKRPLPPMPSYTDFNVSKETRSSPFCSCYICVTASFKGHLPLKKGRGHIRTFASSIDETENMAQNGKNSKTSIKLCKTCFQEIGKGIRHSCVSKPSSSQARENILNIVEKLPEKQQNQLIYSQLKTKIEESDQKNEIMLDTLGPKARVSLNKKIEINVNFTAEILDNFQTTTGASNTYMRKITNFIRTSAGRQSVPANYVEHMRSRSNKMSHIYKDGIYEFEIESNKIENRPVIYANATEILKYIFDQRSTEHIERSKIKIMADGGQKFFKFSISILEDDPIQIDSSENKKIPYSDGGSFAKKRKLNSVYRLILLCIVPNIKETYENVKKIVELTQLNDIPFKFVSDFKLLLIAIGQQTATATYPCPYCFVKLNELQNHDVQSIELKTFKHLKQDYTKFKSSGKDKKNAPQCHSVVNHPLFVKEDDDEDDNIHVIEKCILPELHLLQGFVNHLFWNGLVPLVGREKALLWPKKLKQIPKNYHGDIFEGNACRKLLREADKLEDPEIYDEVGIFKIQPFIASFKAMNTIVDIYFTTNIVNITNINKHLTALRRAFQSTNVSQTLKIHVILDHLEQGLIHLNYDGLGLWSEQAGESIHREFLKFWDRFKINIIDDPTFSARLKKAVVTFSSQHL